MASNTRIFSRGGKIADVLKEVIASIPPKTKTYVVGGAARNAVYYDIFKKALPQRDFDIILLGDMSGFVENLRSHGFHYGKIRRKNDIVLKKGLVPKSKFDVDRVVIDIHRVSIKDMQKNFKENSAFTINGFAVPLRHFLAKDIKKHLLVMPHALQDLKKHKLRLNPFGYKAHPANLYACLRFMSLGFTPPLKKDIELLLRELTRIEAWRFERNVKKVFNYVGGEKKARQLVKQLGIKIDIFDFKKLKKFALNNFIK